MCRLGYLDEIKPNDKQESIDCNPNCLPHKRSPANLSEDTTTHMTNFDRLFNTITSNETLNKLFSRVCNHSKRNFKTVDENESRNIFSDRSQHRHPSFESTEQRIDAKCFQRLVSLINACLNQNCPFGLFKEIPSKIFSKQKRFLRKTGPKMNFSNGENIVGDGKKRSYIDASAMCSHHNCKQFQPFSVNYRRCNVKHKCYSG
ncbi:hypothetical protein HELRODRAFT_175245 [Helobdella robusta]|uniref:Uncharacterized protein n=1 Tax=Helobdella robusta TaxID=6412 RepID=T1F924_HELRO|nr:hypothetical protein HELRODRAFT_175245 [Helobdella robusta]ESO00767.1 hypothetical protein HELRODRAFT_175245 [Helobdella robusta]